MAGFRARWVLPISQPPIPDGWVEVDKGLITGVGSSDPQDLSTDREQLSFAILPGLVNAHTHLELSWMRGQVAPSPTMPQWVERLLAGPRKGGAVPAEPIHDAIAEARAAGTSLVGDVTNTLAAYEPLADSDLSAAIFREILGFNSPDPDALVAQARAEI